MFQQDKIYFKGGVLMRNTLYVLVGLPGSGKTTLAKDIANINIKAKHISSDAIRAELFGDENNQENNSLVFEGYFPNRDLLF